MSNQPGRQRKARMSLLPSVAQGAGLYTKCSTGLDRELPRNSRTKRGVITVAGPPKDYAIWICMDSRDGRISYHVCYVSDPEAIRKPQRITVLQWIIAFPFLANFSVPQDPHEKVAAMGRQASGWLFNSTVQQQQPGEIAAAAAATVTRSDVHIGKSRNQEGHAVGSTAAVRNEKHLNAWGPGLYVAAVP